ncbi:MULTISPECIES: hypothetical protein [Bacillaceae]|nr:hypothetical protein [Ectobacillus funiculus]
MDIFRSIGKGAGTVGGGLIGGTVRLRWQERLSAVSGKVLVNGWGM